jgi:DNA helicase II / ATP-dependent DNA helicase PcrA
MVFRPTPEQEAILAHDCSRHARVLAGPGTGKSATLVALVDQLFSEGEAPRVRLLTFTRAATAELAKKVSGHPAAAAERPSTVHSFAISILARNRGAGDVPEPLRIADDWEYTHIVRPSLAARAGVGVRKLDKMVREMAANWESLRPEENSAILPAERRRFLGAWDEHRRVYGYTLLAELPYALRKGLRDHPDLEGVDYDLLIVDEYQDLNACDLEVIGLIAERGCVVIGAGDDDQSIYSFRKAAPEGIRRFLHDYPLAEDYPLSVTQRCGSNIIEWATHVIDGDLGRAEKPDLSPAPSSPPGEVGILSFEDESAEARGVAKLIRNLINTEGLAPSDVLVLVRGDHNGSFSGPIKSELDRLSVAYADPNRIERLLDEDANRRIMAMYRLLCNREDSLAWATLLQIEPGVGAALMAHLYQRAVGSRCLFAQALLAAVADGFAGAPVGSGPRTRELVQNVAEWLDAHPEPQTDETEWGRWMVAQAGGSVVPPPTPELHDLLAALDELAEPQQGLARYLAQIQPLGEDLDRAESAGVRIMTMASAKGLTVRATVVVGVEEGLVPRPIADLGEERRLLYVALTRSTEHCYCTWSRRRYGPTARAGGGVVGGRRSHSRFLDGGPVESEDGDGFLARRWGQPAG